MAKPREQGVDNMVMDRELIKQDIENEKKLNPELKKIHKYSNNAQFFNNKFELYSLNLAIRSSSIFDSTQNAYELNKALGKGAFGVVKQGTILKTGERVAIKIQNITQQINYHVKTLGNREQAREYVLRQIEIEDYLLQLNKQLIGSNQRINLKNQEKHYSIMKYIDGVLLKDIFSTLSFQQKIQCFIDIAQQVRFLHEHQFVHLDIWQENILYNGQAVLYDYGCAAQLIEGAYASKLKGSHIPPEVIAAHQESKPCIYGTFSDVYALGITFYELFYYDEYYDYSLDNTLEDFTYRYTKYYENIKIFLQTQDDLFAQLIKEMITSDLNQRITTLAITPRLTLIKEIFESQLNEERNNKSEYK